MENVKMSDIAKAAGVSVATVGRVIHNNGFVSEETRSRVEHAINELGYVPNRMARALKQQKSGIIGSLVVYNENNLYQKINGSVIQAAENSDFKLVTIEGRLNCKDEEDIINQFIGMQVDGLVITSNRNITNEMFDKLHSLKIPVVAIERTYNHPYVDNLAVKDFEGSYNAVRDFVKNGHQKIALITSELSDTVEEERYRGYVEALTDSGIITDPSLIAFTPDYSVINGYVAMKQLFTQYPTAVFCTADTLAAGAMQYLYKQKVRIPADVSIIGYDNVLASQLSPPINSVDLAVKDIGKTVFSLLKRRMEDINATAITKNLDTVYVDRGTVKSI